MRTALFVAVVVLAGTGGDVLMTMAMKKVARDEPWTWRGGPLRILRALAQPLLWGGIGLMIVSFLAFITVLSWANMTLVVPATATNYIVGALGARLVLKERVSKMRWAGVLLVATGVLLVCTAK